jgi:hypothetical protein
MPNAKAKLIELEPNFERKPGGKEVEVQFNPESLKVSFSNQLVDPPNVGSSSGASGGTRPQTGNRQYVGQGTTKLSLQLWFDVNAPLPEQQKGAGDVRNLTKDVAYFITPQEVRGGFTVPAVQFRWGSFSFDGVVESLEESLEFFSEDGVPLRASITLSLTQQKIQAFEGGNARAAVPPPGTLGSSGAPAGTQPLAQAPAGSTLQGLAAAQGLSNWQAIAAANGIENPRLLSPGQLIDLNAAAPAAVSASGVESLSGGIGVS